MTTRFDIAFHEAKKHARECYPEESCGIIINDKYVPFKNKAAPIEQHQPDNPNCDCKLCSFRLDDKKYAKYRMQGDIQFIVHAHPDENFDCFYLNGVPEVHIVWHHENGYDCFLEGNNGAQISDPETAVFFKDFVHGIARELGVNAYV